MATYSFNIKSQPKTKYGSKLNAAAHFDYIDRDGAYKNREDLLAYGSGNMPDWAPTPHHYWEAASLYERANGNAYREITWALPSELPLWANESLVQEFCQETFGEKFTYSYAIHSKDSSDPEHDNVHVHIMFNERELTKDRTYDDPKWHFTRYTETDGFPVGYCKSREFMQKATVHKLRERAADLTNKYYKDFNMQERVDHRSFKNQKKALIEEGRFSEAAKFDNVEPQRRIPAAQYYKEKKLQQHIEPDQINKIHNEMSKEVRKKQEELYQEFYNQNVVYAVNLKDYFGDLKHQNIEAAKQLQNEIKELRKEQVPEQAIETWAKNQIVKGYSKKAKALKSIIETSLWKEKEGMLSADGREKFNKAKADLATLESKIPSDLLEQKKQAIIKHNQEINDKIKPLYGKIKPLQAKAKKYDRILQYLNTIPNDTVIARIKDKGIIINNNGIDNRNNTNKAQQNIGKKHKLPNANQARPEQKSYATSLNKAKIIGNIANKIERKVDNIVISNEGGFVATKELTAEDIQEMAHHGQEL